MTYNLRILFFLLTLTLSASSQNLIPNGGFEDFRNNQTLNWFQPSGGFYHFEINKDKARTGLGYNGLCLWKWQNSEFFCVKLNQKLEKGSFYEINFYARRDPNTTFLFNDTISQVGIRFTSSQIVVDEKFVCTDTPNVVLPLDYSTDYIKVRGLFLAKGNEQYLSLGYYSAFHSGDNSCAQKLEVNKYIAMVDSIDKVKKDSIANAISAIKEEYKMDISWQEIEKIKNKKKQQAYYLEFKKMNQQIYTDVQIAVEQIERYFGGFINVGAITNQGEHCTCRVRYYFDDFELVKVPDDQLVAEKIVLNNIYFDIDKAELKPESFVVLDTLASRLLKQSKVLIRIDGHTDNTGKVDKNLELSDYRAKSVVEYLISKGVDANIISYKGFGSSKPIESNDTSTGKSKNRRVEISIVKVL